MVEVRWTPQAAQDLDSITSFISHDSAQYASLFVIDLFQAVGRIAEFPQSGRIVPELGNPGVREIILGSYRVVYRIKKQYADLLTIYHGARLLDPGMLK